MNLLFIIVLKMEMVQQHVLILQFIQMVCFIIIFVIIIKK